MSTAYIALGSNQGDRLDFLSAAVHSISRIPETHVERVSHAYESEPAYNVDQPRFANAVVAITTALTSVQVFEYLQQIESDLGRVREAENEPRTIDLDILLFGDEEMNSEALVIPHPRMLERAFVVVPLLEIAPRITMPNGSQVSSDDATVGSVVADLGLVPDMGAASNQPIAVNDWVEVASCDAPNDVASGLSAAMSLQRQTLQDAGIPYAFDPYEPDAAMDPWGMPRTFRILVPAEAAERARVLIAEANAAVPEFPE
jgi:2-amino-4-hydroxy-6-hydroxymethyldihydropteridine diphosphokinase